MPASTSFLGRALCGHRRYRPASDVLGCPVHRVQALELGPDELVAVGRDAECFTLAHAVQWHCERGVLLSGNVVVVR